MRNFNVGSLDDFVYKGKRRCRQTRFFMFTNSIAFEIDNMTIEDILTPADKQVVIKYALDNIKAQADERHIPGYSASFLYHGQSIVHAALSEELIVNMFSLHKKEFMKRLGDEWWNLGKIFKPQPIEKIRDYFGDAIGIYFSFVGKCEDCDM